MSNIFLDFGTHRGDGLRHFINKFGMNATWDIHTFEANPVVFDEFINDFLHITPYVKPYNTAVSTYNGTITVNIETPPGEGDTGMGSSIIPLQQWDPFGNNTINSYFHRTEIVPCIDISEFIKENFSKEDFIVIKMDIEGSEYDILEKMLSDNVIEYINHLSVEWHSRFFINTQDIFVREQNIISTLAKYTNLRLEPWF